MTLSVETLWNGPLRWSLRVTHKLIVSMRWILKGGVGGVGVGGGPFAHLWIVQLKTNYNISICSQRHKFLLLVLFWVNQKRQHFNQHTFWKYLSLDLISGIATLICVKITIYIDTYWPLYVAIHNHTYPHALHSWHGS